MRLASIELSWFRGAAERVELEAGGKSVAAYGPNASGKSSFIDAVEYALCNGRIAHLAHEYSGKRHEKAVPNTHTPKDRTCKARITLQDASELTIELERDGRNTRVEKGASSVAHWDYRRTILRQHEVANFIHETKSDKYSTLLPLLGLRPVELIAGNLGALGKAVADECKLVTNTFKLDQLVAQRSAALGPVTDEVIVDRIASLHQTYCLERAATIDPATRCEEIATVVQSRIDTSSADQRRHAALLDLGAIVLADNIAVVREANAKLASEADPLIREQVQVLESAREYANAITSQEQVPCPACGRPIAVDSLREHVESEHERLDAIVHTAAARASAINELALAVRTLQTTLEKADLKAWKDTLLQGPQAKLVTAAERFDTEALRADCTEELLRIIERDLLALVSIGTATAKDAPAEVAELASAKRYAEAAGAAFAARVLEQTVDRSRTLVRFIEALERGVRSEIRLRTKRVMDDISEDLRAMWAVLHPEQPIDGIRLYAPADGDRAIEIGLRFHGVEQDSPRLTLSEGYRNALGLCIFLAMAKRDASNDGPVFLDDVVVSFDREHRGMVVELLKRDFAGRQVILFTHDRDWYADLRHQLDGGDWQFKTLLPWESPSTGIRWSDRTTAFADARAQVEQRPDAAANDARRTMDVGLAIIAERLRLRMPYLRADRSDKRMAHEFLEQIASAGRARFQIKKADGEWAPYVAALEAVRSADGLVLTWGNRGSHTKDVVPSEAERLITVCEGALAAFRCSACQKPVWHADVGSAELVQCQCGQIRWKYG